MIFKFLRHVSYHFCYTLGKIFENRGRHFENFTYILTIYSVMFIVTNDSPFINFYVSSFLPFAVHKSNFPSSIQTPIGLTKFQCGILLSRGPRSVYPKYVCLILTFRIKFISFQIYVFVAFITIFI